MTTNNAALILESGSVFPARGIGAPVEAVGEIVFNTSFCGYQEILTDPSYREQIICMAFPAIGNYGFGEEYIESDRVHAAGLIVADAARTTSTGQQPINDYLVDNKVAALEGIDTRAVVRQVRDCGVMRAMILPHYDRKLQEDYLCRIRESPVMAGRDLVSNRADVTAVNQPSGSPRIALIDCGAKLGIVRSLTSMGCRVELCSAGGNSRAIIGNGFDGVVISNGAGDPSALRQPVETVRELLGRIPLFGICLGHQILARAIGGRTFKLPFGHRGANHPVIEHDTGKIRITSQNHGFAVDPESLPNDAIVTETNLYDGTNEGIAIRGAKAFSVQYHPEARPGPNDAKDHFERFLEMCR